VSQEVSTGYTPRKHQMWLHKALKRFNVLVCHRRFGKTVFSLNHTLHRGIRCPRHNPQYAYVAPTYGQAKRVSWDYLKDYTKDIRGVKTYEQELRVDIPRPDRGDRVRIMLLGADNPDAIRGLYLDGVVIDEYAQCDPGLWGEVVRPALSDRLGWAIFIGTPKGQNHFHRIYSNAGKYIADGDPEWFRTLQRASETKIVSKKELESAAATMSEEEYDQEYECSFSAALVGAYYGKAMEKARKEKRITRVPYDPNVPVHTFWDLGINDTTAIWFLQIVGKEYHLIDHYEMSGEDLSHYVKILQEKPYVYGEHTLPHDAAARSLDTGRSRQETLRNLGLRTRILPRAKVEDGINAVRLILSRCWFDEARCERGIHALSSYQRKFDSKNMVFQNKPLHDWASNSADAFRYLAMGTKNVDNGMGIYSDKAKLLPRQADMDYDYFGGF